MHQENFLMPIANPAAPCPGAILLGERFTSFYSPPKPPAWPIRLSQLRQVPLDMDASRGVTAIIPPTSHQNQVDLAVFFS